MSASGSKTARTFRLSPRTVADLAELSARYGRTQASILEDAYWLGRDELVRRLEAEKARQQQQFAAQSSRDAFEPVRERYLRKRLFDFESSGEWIQVG